MFNNNNRKKRPYNEKDVMLWQRTRHPSIFHKHSTHSRKLFRLFCLLDSHSALARNRSVRSTFKTIARILQRAVCISICAARVVSNVRGLHINTFRTRARLYLGSKFEAGWVNGRRSREEQRNARSSRTRWVCHANFCRRLPSEFARNLRRRRPNGLF